MFPLLLGFTRVSAEKALSGCKRENRRGCTVYLHKCKLETKRIVVVVGFAVCQGCSCFSEEGARLLTTSFFSPLCFAYQGIA